MCRDCDSFERCCEGPCGGDSEETEELELCEECDTSDVDLCPLRIDLSYEHESRSSNGKTLTYNEALEEEEKEENKWDPWRSSAEARRTPEIQASTQWAQYAPPSTTSSPSSVEQFRMQMEEIRNAHKSEAT